MIGKREIGAWGEGIAAEYLAGRGYEIVARNVRTAYGEIDIVAERDGVTVMVEVKTLTAAGPFPPEMKINSQKQRHMRDSALAYSAEHDIDHFQVDAISVEGQPGREPVITHFESVI